MALMASDAESSRPVLGADNTQHASTDPLLAPLTPINNPLNPNEHLHQPAPGVQSSPAHPPQPIMPEDSAVTKAEKVERNGPQTTPAPESVSAKRKLDDAKEPSLISTRKHGVAPIKPEFLIDVSAKRPRLDDRDVDASSRPDSRDDRDANAEAEGHSKGKPSKKQRKKQKGQNTNRDFGSSRDALQLCMSKARVSEFTPADCPYGDGCKFLHDIRKYLLEGKRADIDTFRGQCPVFEARGKCSAGWRCRFASAHSKEVEHEDGRKELVLIEDEEKLKMQGDVDPNEDGIGVVNIVPAEMKIKLRKRQFTTPKADAYLEWLNSTSAENDEEGDGSKRDAGDNDSGKEVIKDQASSYLETILLPSEKRRLYYGPETPMLAPLTTQGNLPFRRLAVDLGAQVTWSEMAMGLPLIQGEKAEWALTKAHRTELTPPKFSPRRPVVDGYDNSKDLKFGVQIAGNKPWLATKATETLTSYCPNIRAVDLNCGCPIDLVYRQGAGSALMDSPGRLEKILRGMNASSGEVPVTVKIRMGIKDGKPTADKLIERLAYGGPEASELGIGAPGVQAITLHGRSRQQRYTRLADWEYIAECSAMIKRFYKDQADRTDTQRESDPRYTTPANGSQIYFVGNGDCYSHEDYYRHIDGAKVDCVMVGRGALIKPWVFEEIEKGQLLDKSASERLAYIERFARYGLQTWGSDEIGVGTTRRFLLEWLSFSCRYVPVGILEHLPPVINDRPPAYRGRNELETLLSSDNYRDWIKISEMFLGPAHKDFRFEPKHKSNAYESIEAEG